MLDEKTFEKFMYGHPTINGKETIYQGRKVWKKVKEVVEEAYDLRPTHTVLSNILKQQMEKDRKQFGDIDDLEDQKNGNENSFNQSFNTQYSAQTNFNSQNTNFFSKENNNFLGNSNNMNNYNNNINNNISSSNPPQSNGLLTGIMGDLQREVQRANREFSEREKAMNMMNNLNPNNTNNAMNIPIIPRQDKPLVKRKRGRPPKNLNNAVNTLINSEAKTNPPNTENTNNNVPANPTPNNPNNDTMLSQKKERTPRKYTKRIRGKNFSYLYRNNYHSDPLLDDNENNDMNLLEILFKEYGYNNIVYVLTDSPEIKLGETKIKKIKNGLNTFLGCENNTSRVIETIVKMRKSHLIDDSWIKGKYNYRTRNKNNLYISSYHYQMDNDGFVYKFKHQKILRDGSIRFLCCDPKCNGRGLLFPRIKKFKLYARHSLGPLQHDYIQNGYDKFQYKMEMKGWKEMSLKDNPDDKKSYIDWHRPFIDKDEKKGKEEKKI